MYANCVSWVVKKGTDWMVAIVTIMQSETGMTSEITDSAPYFSSFCFSAASRASSSYAYSYINTIQNKAEVGGGGREKKKTKISILKF